VDGDIMNTINYQWFDIYGKSVIKAEVNIESGLQRMNIQSPVQGGMYFLVVELNGVYSVRKVCVIE
jgi:hypothetical protein